LAEQDKNSEKRRRFPGIRERLQRVRQADDEGETRRSLRERLRFETLLADLSSAFVNLPADRLDDETEGWLGRICEAFGFDRATILEATEKGTIVNVTHSWATPDALKLEGELGDADFPWVAAALRRGEVVAVPNMTDLPEDAGADRKSFERWGTKSHVSVPLAGGGENLGLLALDCVSQERLLPKRDIQRLKIIGEIMANALMRSRSDAALRTSEARLHAAIDSMPFDFWLRDRDGVCVLQNAISRISWGDITGKQTGSADVPVETLKLWDANNARAFAGEVVSEEVRYNTPAGPGFFHNIIAPIRDGQNVIGILGLNIDITDRKLTEQALRESEEKYRNLLELIPDPVVIMQDEVFRLINKAFTEIFGYTRDDVQTGLSYLAPVQEKDRDALKKIYRSRLAGKHVPRTYQVDLVAKNGKIVPVETSASIIIYEGRPANFVVLRDISERRSLEEQFRQAQKMDTVGRLAGGIAHDFNNILTAIMGNAEILLQELHKDDPRVENASDILDAGKRCAALVNQLLAFSSRQTLDTRLVSLNEIVASMSKMLIRLIGEDVRLETELEASLWMVRGDPTQIGQILLNLAVNAREAMPEGGRLCIATRNEAGSTDESGNRVGDFVVLTVTDTGRGMDDETRRQIFEPFFTTKPKGVGAGLGLSTVYGIVNQHGGAISVISTPGEGATFVLRFPSAGEVSESAEDESTTTEMAVGEAERMFLEAEAADLGPEKCDATILLVEDDDIVRNLTGRVLTSLGYRVLAARGGENALRIMEDRRGDIDLVLTDIVMPGMSGRELFERVGALHPGVKVIYMSGYSDDEAGKGDDAEPEAGFLRKPFSRDELAKAVRRRLGAGTESD